MSIILRQRTFDGDNPFDDAPPGRGEAIRRPIPNTEEGIKFEIAKMVQYVQHFSGDPLMVKTARRIVELCPAKDKRCEMNALFLWVKQNFRYINDPPNKELIQTPMHHMAELMTPPSVLEAILGEDLIRQLNGFGVGMSLIEGGTPGRKQLVAGSCFRSELSGLRPKTSGDCDEGATFLATLLAAAGIVPRFRFGGQPSPSGSKCNYFHVWVQGQDQNGEWIDMDVTEEKSTLGWSFPGFGCTGHVDIF